MANTSQAVFRRASCRKAVSTSKNSFRRHVQGCIPARLTRHVRSASSRRGARLRHKIERRFFTHASHAAQCCCFTSPLSVQAQSPHVLRVCTSHQHVRHPRGRSPQRATPHTRRAAHSARQAAVVLRRRATPPQRQPRNPGDTPARGYWHAAAVERGHSAAAASPNTLHAWSSPRLHGTTGRAVATVCLGGVGCAASRDTLSASVD